ncbi:MAG: cache domain-containing protein [Pyrinomonadaceae bacterium]
MAALAFERWFDAQQQPLITLAATAAAEAQLRSTEWQNSLRLAMTPRPHWIDVRILDAAGATAITQPPDAESLPGALIERLLNEIQDSRLSAVETDWTRGVEQRALAVAVPIEGGGVVVARVRAEALDELFRDIKLPSRALLTILDAQGRVVYRSRSMETYLGTDVSNSTLLAALAQERAAAIEVVSPIGLGLSLQRLSDAASESCKLRTNYESSHVLRLGKSIYACTRTD